MPTTGRGFPWLLGAVTAVLLAAHAYGEDKLLGPGLRFVVAHPNEFGILAAVLLFLYLNRGNVCQWLVVKFYLKPLIVGRMSVTFPDGSEAEYGDASSQFHGVLQVHSTGAFIRMVTKETIGLADAYMVGEWDTPNMTRFVEVIMENLKAKAAVGAPGAAVTIRIQGLFRWLFKNTPLQSLENVQRHYDIGNDLYMRMLDPETLSYTCGLWRDPEQLTFKQFPDEGRAYDRMTLGEAQQNKIDYVIRKAGIVEGDRVLEMGCGWGGFSCRAAQTTGCHVEAFTLSVEQIKLARQRAAAAGVDHLVDYIHDDYRAAEGTFDKIVSIGMLEHVGHYDLASFFRACNQLLKPGGTLVVHTITSGDAEYALYRHQTGFMQEYIFPGCCIPAVSAIIGAMTNSGFELQHMDNIGQHYALTLRAWRENFNQSVEELEELNPKGYDERFQRMWDFYLCNCEAEFSTGHFGLGQFVFRRPSSTSLIDVGEGDDEGPQISPDQLLEPLGSLYTAPGVRDASLTR